MKHLIIVLLSLFSLGLSAQTQTKMHFKFVSKEDAKKLLTTEDSYTDGWNKFDIASRLKSVNGTKEELINLAGQEALEWTGVEKGILEAAAKLIESNIGKYGFKIQFPSEILLVKTGMREEAEAGGYTRKNWIALGDKVFERYSEKKIQELLAHELFHILTRNDLEFKKRAYATIGFSVIEQELVFPDDLLSMRISNPDVSKYDSYASFTVNGEQKKCTMCLYTNKAYTDGDFAQYWNVGIIPLDEQLNIVQEDGKTVILSVQDISDFYDLIGKNTNYIIHPEEILAVNFAFAILDKEGLPNPEVKERLQQMLRGE